MGRGNCRGEGIWWHGKLQGCGYRITAGREAVLDVLTESPDKHLSAEDIYIRVHDAHPGIGLTTVYRTLDILVDMGMVYKLDFGDGRARYELALSAGQENHHHHLVCTTCKKVIDYTDFIDDEVELLQRTEKGLSEKYRFDIKNHLIQFYGVCNDCKSGSVNR